MGQWGNTKRGDELVLERFDSKSQLWKFVETVTTRNASVICKNMTKKTKISHRVRNTGTNEIYCES